MPVEPTVPTQPAVASPVEPEQNGVAGNPLSRRGFLRVAGVAGLTGVAGERRGLHHRRPHPRGASAPRPARAPRRRRRPPAPASVDPRRGGPVRVRLGGAVRVRRALGVARREHPARLDRARRRRPRRRPPLRRQPRRRPPGDLPGAGRRRSWPTSSASRTTTRELQEKPAFVQVPQLVLADAVSPLSPETDGEWKVFRLTIDEIEQQIDELKPTVAALGYNKQTPGPTIRVNEGDKVRAIFTNNLKETTGVHFHGVEFDDFFMDGVPFVTQKPFAPGRVVHLRVHGQPRRAR